MRKRIRIISLVLSCIIIIGFVSLSYGADFEPVTGAAFGFSYDSGIKAGISEIKAVATDTTTVAPATSNGMQYYFNGTSITSLGSIGTSISSWGSMVGALTQAFAYSARGVATAIQNSSTITWPTVNYYFSPTTSDNGTNVNFSVSSASSFAAVVNQVSEFFREVWKYEYKMGRYLMPDFSSYNYADTAWTSWYRRSVDTNIVGTTNSYSTESLGLGLKNTIYDLLKNQYFSIIRTVGYVKGESYANNSYQNYKSMVDNSDIAFGGNSIWADIRTGIRQMTQMGFRITGNPTQEHKIWKYDNTYITPNNGQTVKQYMFLLGEHLSNSLGRLAYVLANDEDIALRQQTEDQQNAYKTNFTASGASARMSASDIGSAGDSVSELKSAFTSSASSRDAFNGFSAGTDGRWNWFSTEILNSLDTTTNNRKSNDNLTNFLGDYYNEVTKYAD